MSSFKLSRLFKINEPDVKWKPKINDVRCACVHAFVQIHGCLCTKQQKILFAMAKVTATKNLSYICITFALCLFEPSTTPPVRPHWKIVIITDTFMVQNHSKNVFVLFSKYLEALMLCDARTKLPHSLYLMLLHDTTVYSSSVGFCFVLNLIWSAAKRQWSPLSMICILKVETHFHNLSTVRCAYAQS